MKIRVCFSKTENGRYLSHLDLMRALERGLRRIKTPLAFTEGFNPHIKLSTASALAVGVTGQREYFDLELAERIDTGSFGEQLDRALPSAISIITVKEIEKGSKSLSALIDTAVYNISAVVMPEERLKVIKGIDVVMNSVMFMRKPRVKPGKSATHEKDVRPLIRRLELISVSQSGNGMDEKGERLRLEAELMLSAGGQLRPTELWEMVCEAGGLEPPGSPPVVSRVELLVYQDSKALSLMDV